MQQKCKIQYSLYNIHAVADTLIRSFCLLFISTTLIYEVIFNKTEKQQKKLHKNH